jgi:mannosyltransferase OCH1-like enzyme
MCHVKCYENRMNVLCIFFVRYVVLKKFGMIYSDLDNIYLYACKHDFYYLFI